MERKNPRKRSGHSFGSKRHQRESRRVRNRSGPPNFGRSPRVDESRVRERGGGRDSSELSLPTREERSGLTESSDTEEMGEERVSNLSVSSSSLSTSDPLLNDLTLVTRQQSADLLAAHLRWGHRSFRRCAQVLGIPASAKSPFCVACVEAKASRHPRRARGVETPVLREPAVRPGFRLFFDPIGPFRVPTLSRFKYA